MANADVRSRPFPGEFLKDGYHHPPHGSRQDSAANDHRMPLGFVLKRLADLFANTADVLQIQIAIWLAGRTDADERQLRLRNGLIWIVGGSQSARLRRRRSDLSNLRLDDCRQTTIYEVDLLRNRIHPDQIVSVLSQAGS